MRNTYYMWGIERNKDPELPMKQRNTSWFVILDDRKHGRAGKFPVFYDIDTGDYLEPPEGFLDSPYETLREWYAAHPEDDHRSPDFKPKAAEIQPLSESNSDLTRSDITEEDIPEPDENFLEAQKQEMKEVMEELGQPMEEIWEQQDIVEAAANIPDVPEVEDVDFDDAAPF